MSGVFKAIGKVFKSVGKAIKNVVKGTFKVIKKIAPYVLAATAIYFGGAALANAFAPGGAGLAASGSVAGASAQSGLSAGFIAANPSYATVMGLTPQATTGLSASGLLTAAQNVGSSVMDGIRANPALVTMASGALSGVQNEKTAAMNRAADARQTDLYLAQRRAEDQWNGGVMGVGRDGEDAGGLIAMEYEPQAQQPAAEEEAIINDYYKKYYPSGLQ